jgi:hypothetical protein
MGEKNGLRSLLCASNIGFIKFQLCFVGDEHCQTRIVSFHNGGYDREGDIVPTESGEIDQGDSVLVASQNRRQPSSLAGADHRVEDRPHFVVCSGGSRPCGDKTLSNSARIFFILPKNGQSKRM